MTVCPQCFTHIGPARTSCGSCGVTISRDNPNGRATHAYDGTRVVFMRRANYAREFDQRHPTRRAEIRSTTALGQVDLDSLGHRDDVRAPIGAFNYGRTS